MDSTLFGRFDRAEPLEHRRMRVVVFCVEIVREWVGHVIHLELFQRTFERIAVREFHSEVIGLEFETTRQHGQEEREDLRTTENIGWVLGASSYRSVGREDVLEDDQKADEDRSSVRETVGVVQARSFEQRSEDDEHHEEIDLGTADSIGIADRHRMREISRAPRDDVNGAITRCYSCTQGLSYAVKANERTNEMHRLMTL